MLCSVGMFFVTAEQKNLLLELAKANWATYILGLAIVGLEFGFICVYRAGWKIGVANLFASIALACVLLLIGVLAFIAKLSERYRIREIAYDRYGAEKIRRDLEELGAEHGFTVFPFGQGFVSMSPPSKDFYQFVMEGKIRHGKHPVLDWNMGNVIVDQDAAGNIKPNKKKSTEKIDGVVALIMGFARAALCAGAGGSIYDERGLLYV